MRLPGNVSRAWILVALLLALVIVPFVAFGEGLEAWTRAELRSDGGWVLQSVCVLLLAADVLLPVPSSLVGAACGAWWGAGVGTLVGALGLTLGSMLGWAIGRRAGAGGIGRWVGDAECRRIESWFARRGPWIVALLRPVPVLAEASAILAGVARMPWPRYLAISTLANVATAFSYAAAGTMLGRLPPWATALALLLVLALFASPWRRRAALAPLPRR